MIRNRNEACQQAYNHADKIEPRIHQLQLPDMPAANSFPILYFLKQPHGICFVICISLQQILPCEVLNRYPIIFISPLSLSGNTKKPPLCMHREEIFGYVQEAERYFLYYDTLLYKPISFFKQALRLLNRTYRTFLLSLRNSLFFSAVKFFFQLIGIILFRLINLHNLFGRKYLSKFIIILLTYIQNCLLYTSPSPRDS